MNELLLNILAQVAEQMGFLTPVGPGEGEVPDALCIAVGFHGPSAGQVRVVASRPRAEALARNLLAIEPGDPVADADALDALKELANIVAGNCLPQLLRDGEYHLDAPQATNWIVGGETARLSCAEGELAIAVQVG
jgi:CheY-specific phosphatase CheX